MAGSIPAWSAVWMDFAVRDALAAGLPWTHIAIEDTVRTLGVAEAQFSHGVQEQNFVFALADSSIGLANITICCTCRCRIAPDRYQQQVRGAR